MASSLPTNDCTKWLNLGLEAQQGGIVDFLSSKRRFFIAGKCFFAARQKWGEREGWEDHVKAWIASVTPRSQKPVTSLRSIQAYSKFFSDLIEWAKAENPKATEKELEDIAIKMAMDTPGSYNQVLRCVNLLRDPFGYDQNKYQRNKVSAGLGQIEFDFERVASSLDVLSQLGSSSLTFKLPKDKSEEDALKELRGKLQMALSSIDSRLADSAAVEVGGE